MHFNGLSIQGGLAIGKARLYYRKDVQIPLRKISASEVSSEIVSLQESLNQIENELNQFLDSQSLSETEKDILHSHLLILRDPEIEKELLHTIESLQFSAAAAVNNVYNKICQQFKEMENEFFAARMDDYSDVSQRILDKLLNQSTEDDFTWEADDIAILEEIAPSQVSSFARRGLKAYCCQRGSYNSHASILSRALGITAVVGIENLKDQVAEGDPLILDATAGMLIVKPSPVELAEYRKKQNALSQKQQLLQEQAKQAPVTKYGQKIELLTNIELPEEMDLVLKLEPDGIGLFRTEFLYLDRQSLPTEEEQYEVYRDIAAALSPKPLTIRTFDLGGDKLSHLIPGKEEQNPYLGSRGFRFSMEQPQLFQTQLRAILRASVCGKIKVMFPMIIDASDFLKAKAVIINVMRELDEQDIPYDRQIALGSMIEIPSAALSAHELARHCDFLSIGTNDLVQYTLATDRNNDAVASYYIQHHPAVLKLIACCIEAAEEYGTPLSVCGEMASLAHYTPLLIGMGIKSLSVNPHQYINSLITIRNCDESLPEEMKGFDPGRSLDENELMLKRLARFAANDFSQ